MTSVAWEICFSLRKKTPHKHLLCDLCSMTSVAKEIGFSLLEKNTTSWLLFGYIKYKTINMTAITSPSKPDLYSFAISQECKSNFICVTFAILLAGTVDGKMLASFPHRPVFDHLQYGKNWREKPGIIYHVNDVVST